jgi:Holliday junction resolvasome RuvABC DNA-binding subunit
MFLDEKAINALKEYGYSDKEIKEIDKAIEKDNSKRSMMGLINGKNSFTYSYSIIKEARNIARRLYERL